MSASALDPNLVTRAAEIGRGVLEEVQRVYIGPAETVQILFATLLARGHALLEGVPGVAKTTLVKTFARVMGCTFKRVQFTPDLLPSDITGTYVLNLRDNTFVLRRGPIFSQVVLGDEINRAPAKTQSALLEAMAEGQVTIEAETHRLEAPFMVLATQNPVEQEGVYLLPEAQLDRFMVKVLIGYPTEDDERRLLQRHSRPQGEPRTLLGPADVLKLRELCDTIHVADEISDYVLGLARFTRTHRHAYLGVSPRAALNLVSLARARALLAGRSYVLPDDIKQLCYPVLTHRILLTPDAELEGVTPTAVVGEGLEAVRYVPPQGR
ncbi:MAG TPA: MoxR family ATPase [Myxococcota bacterium]|nr:MoxR family ATPase [Myxococcota bacterium]